MKKLFLASAIALSMAVSTSAFAAVSYGNSDTLGVVYNPTATQTASANSVSVTSDLSSYDGQMTVLVTDTNGAVAASNILYIDQAEAGANIFQNMGLLLANDATTLPVGTYYVKVGGENVASILLGTIVVTADQQTTYYTIKNGDVDDNGTIELLDASSIVNYIANSANNGSDNTYAIGANISVIVED